jgi:hypothetical protein
VTERAYVLPPGSQIGPITPQQRHALVATSLVSGVYEKAVDSESAYEMLKARTEAAQAETTKAAEASGGFMGGLSDVLFGSKGPRGGSRDGLVQQVLKPATWPARCCAARWAASWAARSVSDLIYRRRQLLFRHSPCKPRMSSVHSIF